MDACPDDQNIAWSIATSAIIYSHRDYRQDRSYTTATKCILRFKPAIPGWRLSVKLLDYDLPMEPHLNDVCSDSVIFSNLTLSLFHRKIAAFDDRNRVTAFPQRFLLYEGFFLYRLPMDMRHLSVTRTKNITRTRYSNFFLITTQTSSLDLSEFRYCLSACYSVCRC